MKTQIAGAFAEMGERWWMAETSWFSFCKPEEKLGGWLTINGHAGHGEDQDMWPVHDWAAFRRAARKA